MIPTLVASYALVYFGDGRLTTAPHCRQRAVPAMVAMQPESFPSWEEQPFFRFELVHESRKPGSRARVGRIHTPHGIIDTPGFVPVGTNGALKGMTNEQSAAAGVQLMLCNTYNLLVHPGPDVVRAAGGLHDYIGRQAPLITDSGGFQVFSLATPTSEDGPELKQRSAKRKGQNTGSVLGITEDGVRFRSYYDSREILLTPESSVETQKALGVRARPNRILRGCERNGGAPSGGAPCARLTAVRPRRVVAARRAILPRSYRSLDCLLAGRHHHTARRAAAVRAGARAAGAISGALAPMDGTLPAPPSSRPSAAGAPRPLPHARCDL